MAEKPNMQAGLMSFEGPQNSEEEVEVLKTIERMDEEVILAELKGRVIDKLFHEMDIRGKKVVQLSWVGVKWFTLRQGHIEIEKLELKESDDKWMALAWARDKLRDVRTPGVCEQPKMMTANGVKMHDDFALQKAVSKAKRNALKDLISETMIAEAYIEWKSKQSKPS